MIFDLPFPEVQSNTSTINPIKNPPVAPKNADIPPLKFEKTGIPITPSIKYTDTLKIAYFRCNVYPASAIAKVWRVSGICPMGIAICEHIAIVAAKIAANT